MMFWLSLLLLVALVVTLIIFWRRHLYWRQVDRGIEELAAGRRPPTVLTRRWKKSTALRNLHRIAKEQRRLRRNLAEEEFNLSAIFRSMVEGVMVTDDKHTIRIVNDAFEQLFQVSGDPRGRTVLASLREASVEEVVKATLVSGEPQWREITLVQSAEGQPSRHIEMNAVPVKHNSTTRGVVAVFHDITRLRQLEKRSA